jgi:hypothetical protein
VAEELGYDLQQVDEIPFCQACGYFDCVCAIRAAHKKGCSYLRMALSKIGFPCDVHGLDVCEDCTPCTCKEMP